MAFLIYHMAKVPGPGITVVLMENGQVTGEAKRDFPDTGERSDVVMFDDTRHSANIISSNSSQVVVEDHNGIVLRLVPWSPGDGHKYFNSSMYHTYWTAV